MRATALKKVISAERSKYHPEAIDLMIEVETDQGTVETWPFGYLPSDLAPITQQVTEWFKNNPQMEIRPAPKLTHLDFGLNRRDVRVAFIGLGLPADAVEIALARKTADSDGELLKVDWLEGERFGRNDPVIVATLEHYIGLDPTLTPEKLDAKWLSIGMMNLSRGAPSPEGVQ
jgi:hypothetical protein